MLLLNDINLTLQKYDIILFLSNQSFYLTNHFYSCQIIQYHEIYFSLLTSLIITFIRCLFNIYVICKYFCYDLFLYCNGIRLTLLYEVVATLSPVESNDTFNILPGPSWDRIS